MTRERHPPGAGMPKLVHTTVQTKHRAEYALDLLNYGPRAIRVAERMFASGEVVGGFSLQLLDPEQNCQHFLVLTIVLEVDHNPISSNYVGVENSSVLLATNILPAAARETEETLGELADI